jgi:phage-related tail protein
VEIFQLHDKVKSKELEIQEYKKFEEMYKEALSKNDRLSAEINHLIKKSESQTRDLKKTMKENAEALSEFEKALIRKSGECDVSRRRRNELN